MARRSWSALMGVVLCTVLVVPPAQADWVKNGTAVSTVMGNQSNPTIVSDGAGGAIVTWQDGRNGGIWQIYAQRLNASGAVQWTTDGVALSTATADQYAPTITSDGAGGAIVTWYDLRSGNGHIYAQRLNASGAVQWTTDGVALCTAAGYQEYPTIISDGAGGAIVTWWDYRSTSNFDIYAQRVDASGAVQWTTDGVALCTAMGDQGTPTIVSDGAGGAIVTWYDGRNGIWDIYAQRVDASGAVQWTTDGVALCAAPGDQQLPTITSDGAGGAIVTWGDYRSGSSWDIYAQRVDASGAVQWTTDGVALSTATGDKWNPTITSDGADGAIVAWKGGDSKSYAQRIDGDGNCLWLPEGVCAFPFPLGYYIRMIADTHGGAIIALDSYADSGRDHIYAQKLDPAGNLLWAAPRGVGVCTSPLHQYGADLTTDGHGGAIIAWMDERVSGNWDIYCQRVGPEGLWGDPEPTIISSLDLPDDQGGWVRVKMRASSHDIQFETDYPIAGYDVWRKIGESGSVANSAGGGQAGSKAGAAEGGAGSAVDRARLLELFTDPKRLAGIKLSNDQAHILGFPPGEWESVAFQFATRDTAYNIAAPTRNDSTSNGIPWEIYVVTAHTSTAGLFVTSKPDSGYSVDNLAPGSTGGFAGVQSLSPPGLRLTWTQNDAPDLWKYNVHRGDDPSFIPDGSNLVGTTTETTLIDADWAPSDRYFYKLLAIDRHGNASPEALLTPDNIKVGTQLQNFTASLVQSWIEVSWTLSEGSPDMKFYVLRADAAAGAFGEISPSEIANEGRTFTCKDRSCEPGSSYKYRVDAVDASGRWTLFETSAITTPAMPLTLYQNHPNPFNPSTVIGYYMPDGGQVTLDVYDSSGRLVTRLLDRERQAKGTHSVEWHGIDAQGRAVSSGVYFYRFLNGKETISKKMVLLK